MSIHKNSIEAESMEQLCFSLELSSNNLKVLQHLNIGRNENELATNIKLNVIRHIELYCINHTRLRGLKFFN